MMDNNGEMFRAVFENSPVGLVLVNEDTTLRDVNNYMFRSFHLNPSSIEGKMFGNVFNCAVVSGKNHICGEADDCRDCRLRGGITTVLNEGITIPDTVMDHSFIIDGVEQKKWFKVSATRIEEDGDVVAIVSFVDITTQKDYEELLNSQLSLDMATGATNKYALLNTLKTLTAGKNALAVAMIDFDNFKDINDKYGHITGDRVLNIFSAVAKDNIRKQDILGRFGGEEFMLVFPDASSGLLIKALQRIYKFFRESCKKELSICPTFSAGITEFSAQQMSEMNIDLIISEADNNLYFSKSHGKNMITAGGVSIPFKQT